MKLLISTHCDDETLFAGLTVIRELPIVAIVFDGYVQHQRGFNVTAAQRRIESHWALAELGAAPPVFLGFPDTMQCNFNVEAQVRAELRQRFPKAEQVWCPAVEADGHDQHNLVARAATAAFGNKIVDRYLSYTRACGKSVSARPVPVESGEWIRRKLRALSCYISQIDIAELGCRPHFTRDQTEYYA